MKDTQSPHEFIKSNDVVLLCVKELKHLQVPSSFVMTVHLMKQSINLLDSYCHACARAHLVCKDIAMILSFEQSKGKLILVNHTVLHTVFILACTEVIQAMN